MDEQTASDLAFRVRAVELMQAGTNVTQLARDLGIHRFTLYQWRKIYQQRGPAGLALARTGRRPLLRGAKAAYARLDENAQAQARIGELERKVGQQALQIDFLTRAFKR